MLLMTADEHAFNNDLTNAINELNAVQSAGGKDSIFLWYPYGLVSASQVNTWLSAGHAVGIHFDDTAETDSSGVGGSGASWSGMQSVITNALSSFAATYPSAPTPITTRDHFLIWLSRNAAGSPDQTAQAKLFQAAGIKLDTSYSSFPNRWGYMGGTGLPMKFLDATTGTVIPVYEQPTQYEDDVQLGTASYSTQWNLSTAQTHYQKSLSDSLTKYNTAVTFLFHPDSWSTYSNYAQTVLQYAQTNSIPMYSTAAWLQFWQARALTTVSMPSFALNTLTFNAGNVPAGLTLLVPRNAGPSVVTAVSVDGVSQAVNTGTFQGVQYASIVLASSGAHSVSVTYSAPVTYTISGNVSVAGATVTLSGTASATTTTDASGNYSLTALSNGSYTVTPTKSGYTFSPTSASATVNNANITGVNFTAAVIPTYSISGNVSVNGAGASVTLTGAANAAATADASGNFGFTGLSNGSYTVTPSKSGYTFSPASASVTVSGTNVTGVNFTATALPPVQTLFTTQTPAGTNYSDGSGVNYELGMAFTSTVAGQVTGVRFWKASSESGTHTGRIWSSTGTLLASVVFSGETASGWQQQLLAAPLAISANTTYVVSVNTGNTYYVATNSGLATQIVNGNLRSVVGNNGVYGSPATFPSNSWQASNYFRDVAFVPGATYSLSGNASAAGNGATVTLSGTASATATADGSGNFTFSGLPNGSYTVTPVKTGYTFNPTSATATVNGANVTGVNFTATVVTYSISGNVSATGSGATVTLSGTSSGTATADSSGNFTFTGLSDGSYTVTPAKTGFTFSPASAPATVSGANVIGINFTASAVTYTLSGNASSTGANATVALTGAASATTTADASGNFSFTGLANGSYTVTPTKSGVNFSPASAPVAVNGANVTGINFTATGVVYSISGNVSAAGASATVTLSGAASATTTADSSGNFTFTNLSNGSYTVTPTKAGYTFTPSSAAATLNGANVTGLSFTAMANPTYSISGNVSATGASATVALSGAASATTTADASGNYTFTGLLNGSYTITPSKSGYVFTPLNQVVTINSANATGVNFTAAVPAGITIDATVFGDQKTPATKVVSAAFSTTTANELLLAFIGTDVSTSSGTNNSVTSVTGGGLTWALVQRTNTQRGTAEIWRAFATTTLTSVTVTANYSFSNVSSITVMSFKGVVSSGTSGSGAIGAVGSGNGTTGSATASLITTKANSLVVGVVEDWNAPASATIGANQTLVHQLAVTGLASFWTQRQTAVTPTAGSTVTINDTAPTGDMYNISICEILAGP
jgi:hypothetical protein